MPDKGRIKRKQNVYSFAKYFYKILLYPFLLSGYIDFKRCNKTLIYRVLSYCSFAFLSNKTIYCKLNAKSVYVLR